MARTKKSPPRPTYARRLLELANEQNQAVETGRNCGLGEILAANPVFRIPGRPGGGKTERKAVIEKTFRGRVSPLPSIIYC